MAFDNREVAIRARQLLAEQSESAIGFSVPRIVALIPQALSDWARMSAKDPDKKELFKTDVSATLASGIADLSNYVDGTSNRVMLNDIRNSVVYATVGGVRKACTWVGSQEQLNNARRYDADRIAIFLDGYKIRTRNTDGSLTSLTGTLDMVVADIPDTVAEIPAQLQADFIQYLALLVSQQIGVN